MRVVFLDSKLSRVWFNWAAGGRGRELVEKITKRYIVGCFFKIRILKNGFIIKYRISGIVGFVLVNS